MVLGSREERCITSILKIMSVFIFIIIGNRFLALS